MAKRNSWTVVPRRAEAAAGAGAVAAASAIAVACREGGGTIRMFRPKAEEIGEAAEVPVLSTTTTRKRYEYSILICVLPLFCVPLPCCIQILFFMALLG